MAKEIKKLNTDHKPDELILVVEAVKK